MSAFDRQGVRVSSTLLKQHLDLARVRVAEGGLWLDEVLVLARADVASVTFEFDERTRVHIRNREGNSVSCAFTSLDDARELVKAFGRAPDRTMIEIPLVPSLLSAGFGSPVWWRSYLIAGGAVAAWLVALLLVLGRAGFMNPFLRGAGASSLPGWGFAIVVAAALAAIALVTRAPRARDAGYPGDALSQTMELGADGVRIRGALANDFAPYEAIRAVTSRDDTLVLTLQDGHEATTALKVPSRMPEIVARIQGQSPTILGWLS